MVFGVIERSRYELVLPPIQTPSALGGGGENDTE